VRESGHQIAVGIEGHACRPRVTLGQVLVAEVAENAKIYIVVGQPFEVIGVIHVRMVGLQADEAIAGGHGRDGFALLVVGVGGFQLRLLGVAAVGVAGFQLLEILDGLVIGAVGHGGLGFAVDLVGRPA